MNALIRHNSPINGLSTWLDSFFNDPVFESIDREIMTGNFPKVDITENEDHYSIKADLPGLEKSDVSIALENGTLTIEGEKKEETKKEHGKYYHLERSYGRFSRSFMLPDEVLTDKIEAKMNNGVLDITLPKAEKTAKKSVEVKIQ